jgi:hypothetical protein
MEENMASKKSDTTFMVDAKITLETNCEISAESLEKALEHARTLTIHDFVNFDGDHNDSSLELRGIYSF